VFLNLAALFLLHCEDQREKIRLTCILVYSAALVLVLLPAIAMLFFLRQTTTFLCSNDGLAVSLGESLGAGKAPGQYLHGAIFRFRSHHFLVEHDSYDNRRAHRGRIPSSSSHPCVSLCCLARI
jgi:hypothetical protein